METILDNWRHFRDRNLVNRDISDECKMLIWAAFYNGATSVVGIIDAEERRFSREVKIAGIIDECNDHLDFLIKIKEMNDVETEGIKEEQGK